MVIKANSFISVWSFFIDYMW